MKEEKSTTMLSDVVENCPDLKCVVSIYQCPKCQRPHQLVFSLSYVLKMAGRFAVATCPATKRQLTFLMPIPKPIPEDYPNHDERPNPDDFENDSFANDEDLF